jgi:RNA polymerase sigma-70 factor, ECF subfamily
MKKSSLEKDKLLSTLMINAQSGDKKAYTHLLKECQVMIQNYLRARLHSNPAIDDITQESLMGIHKARHTYEEGRSFLAWMITITKYKYIDYL